MTQAPKKVPRRMKRFYREATSEKYAEEAEYTRGYEDSGRGSFSTGAIGRGYEGDLEGAFKKVDTLPAKGKQEKELFAIPSMEYEDMNLDRKNEKALREMGDNEMEEKLALFEIEKFKKEKKRLPTLDEKTMIAENVYEQMKKEKEEEKRGLSKRDKRKRAQTAAADIDTDMSLGVSEESKRGRRPRRGKARTPIPGAPSTGELGAVSDIKDLFGESEPSPIGKKMKDDMDLGLGDLDDDLGELGDIGELDFDLSGKKKKKKV